jgi:hypothetical protein
MLKLLIFSQTKKSLGARTTMDDLVFVFLLFVKLAFLWTNMFMNYSLFSSSYICSSIWIDRIFFHCWTMGVQSCEWSITRNFEPIDDNHYIFSKEHNMSEWDCNNPLKSDREQAQKCDGSTSEQVMADLRGVGCRFYTKLKSY